VKISTHQFEFGFPCYSVAEATYDRNVRLKDQINRTKIGWEL